MDNFNWKVRVRATERDIATAYVRGHDFEVGLPVRFDEQYQRITALEYVLGAVGADVVNGLQSASRRRRVGIDNVEAVVSGKLNNPLVALAVVGEEGHPGLERIGVKVYVSSAAPEEEIRRAWDETLDRSPLLHTFKPVLELELRVEV